MSWAEQAVKSILQQCYGNPETVTDELVELILKPGLQPGAARVFLDFISYSGGPLPEELLQIVPCPVSILWGTTLAASKEPRALPQGGRMLMALGARVMLFKGP